MNTTNPMIDSAKRVAGACTIAFGLVGCGTVNGIKEDISSAVGVVTGSSTSQPAATEAPQTQVIQAQPQRVSKILHPDIQPALNDIGAKRNQSFDAEAKCPASLLMGDGPTSAATNRRATGNAGKQVENAFGTVVNQGLARLGTLGQVVKPTTDAVGATTGAVGDQLQLVCSRIGIVNKSWLGANSLSDAQKGPIYQTGYNNLSTAMTLAANGKLTDGAVTRNGVDAMIGRGTNQSQTIFWGKVVNGIYSPQGPGGVLGDGIRKLPGLGR